MTSGKMIPTAHPSAVVRRKMPGRTMSVHRRVFSDLRNGVLGNYNSYFYPFDVISLSAITGRVLKLRRQYPHIPVLMTKRHRICFPCDFASPRHNPNPQRGYTRGSID